MFYPAINTLPEKIYRTDSFGGLQTGNKSTANTFSQMENLTCDSFPRMSVREKRGIFADKNGNTAFPLSSSVTAAVNTAEGVIIITEDSIFFEGKKIENISLLKGVKNRSAVPIGRNVFIIPDGIYLKFSENGIEAVLCNYEKKVQNTFFNFCLYDGTDIFPSYYGSFPQDALTGEFLAVCSSDSMELYSYSGSEWIWTDNLYIRISLCGDTAGFSDGQSVYIESDNTSLSSGHYTVKKVTPESLILMGSIAHEEEGVNITVRSEVPRMDFAVEHNNRVWGCRFGENNQGEFVNEIYASKLGDPTAWFSYQGISTDSYTANLGCSGEFTGAAALGSEVLFFKEDYIIRVFGLVPSEFQVTAVPARGVEKGAYKTVVNLNERVFYKNSEGIMLYDGTFPVNVSAAINSEIFTAHTAGGIDGRYYISMTDSKNERGLFVFDTATGLWHREDDRFCTEFIFPADGRLIFLGETEKGCHFYLTSYKKNKNGTGLFLSSVPLKVVPEDSIFWFAVTGMREMSVPEKERLRCIYITLSLGEDSFIEISLQTDEKGETEKIFFLDRSTKGIVRIPVSVAPCIKSRLIFSGSGECTVCSVERCVRKSGEVKNID